MGRMLAIAKQADRAELRNFGLIVGGIFCAIGLWPALIRGGDARIWCLIVAVLLIVPAVTAPAVLWPAHRAWMALGAVLGFLLFGIVGVFRKGKRPVEVHKGPTSATPYIQQKQL